MNENIFYLPINSNLLSSYLGKGLILPRKYISEKIFDIQVSHTDYLLFIKQKWLSGDYTNDCCLEVVLTQAEIESLLALESFALLNNALPISRIKKIYFKNEDQKRKTLYNIQSGDGFVPNIVEVDNAESFLEIKQITTSKAGNVNNLSENSKIFNQILGGLAAMKLSGKILKEYNSNYSENYFATLGSINSVIKNDAEFAQFSTKSSVANIFISNKEQQWN